jgi:plasmid rolling circle replication initiator protein Rep
MLDDSGNGLFLTDISAKDKPWDTHRAIADTVQNLYRSSKLVKYADRISTCGKILEFALRNADDGNVSLKLQSTRFCRVRHCPVCQWRRSMKWQAKMFTALPQITQAYPKHRWLFLTLTVRNCDLSDLRETVKGMNKGFERLTKLKVFPGIGWIRSVEVTRNPQTGQAHPHFHCLLLVPSGYFKGRGYIKQEDWRLLWQQCMRLDYLPVVNVKAVTVKPDKDTGQDTDIGKAICETLKYSVKESDLVADSDWLAELTMQLHKTRAISIGGVLKEYLREEKEDDDLINIEEDSEIETNEEDIKLYFGWREVVKRYQSL